MKVKHQFSSLLDSNFEVQVDDVRRAVLIKSERFDSLHIESLLIYLLDEQSIQAFYDDNYYGKRVCKADVQHG